MTDDAIDHILSLLAKGQGRTFDAGDAELWLTLLEDLHPQTAKESVLLLLRETSDFITPAMIRQRTAAVAKSRVKAVPEPKAPAGLSTSAYIAWRTAWVHTISTGGTPDAAARAALTAVDRPDLLGRLEGTQRLDPPAALPARQAIREKQREQGEVVEGEVLTGTETGSSARGVGSMMQQREDGGFDPWPA